MTIDEIPGGGNPASTSASVTDMDPSHTPPERPVLVYDGDCGFCRSWIARWRRSTGDAVEYLAQQDPECPRRFPNLDPAALRESVHRVEVGGEVTRGAEAVIRTLAQAPRWERFARRCLGWRRGMVVAEWAYRKVAHHRGFFSAVNRWLGL